MKIKRAAHFLLVPELLHSPPNTEIIQILLQLGFEVHIFSPGSLPNPTSYGCRVVTHRVDYSFRWLLRNLGRRFWWTMSYFSGTSEDPLAVVGILSSLTRRPSFLLVDEIKAGDYRGNSSERWKSISRWAMRKANFNIVNDDSRIRLLRDYAPLPPESTVLVYPGCYSVPPRPSSNIRAVLRNHWMMSEEALVVASSGGFNLTAGAEWLIKALHDEPTLHAVIQPLGVSPLALFLLNQLNFGKRLYLEKRRLSWHEAWTSAVAFDIGLAIYSNPAPQFQRMGISSNRLCMFIAMGVPVICSKQESFKFVEAYDCGCLVSSYGEFLAAIHHIRSNLKSMRSNCHNCFNNYIMPQGRRPALQQAIAALPQRSALGAQQTGS